MGKTRFYAISKLVNQGILYRKRGNGSFVAKPDIQKNASGCRFALILPFNITQGGIFGAVDALNHVFSGLGHQLSIHIGKAKASENIELLESLYNQNADGVVYYPIGSDLPEDILMAFAKKRKPVIILDKANTHPEFSSVVCDNYRGSYMLTEHLLSYGHTKTCYLSQFLTKERSSINDRYRGYEACLSAFGNDIKPRFTHWDVSVNEQEKYYVLKYLVNTLYNEGITAILCENDAVAFNVYMCCQNLGYRIPEDISITGFDNIVWSTTGNAQITTIDQNFRLIGETVAKTILAEDYAPKNHIVPVQLIPRASTGRIACF
jgi:DNA-binding LacI/PurR family transcriptional regulator